MAANNLNPLTWNVPITNKDGTPTAEFMRKWQLQQVKISVGGGITTAAQMSTALDLLNSANGSLLERLSTGWGGLASPSDTTKFLNGSAIPAYAKVKDTDLAVTDVVGNNVSIAAHGFAPKSPNDSTKFLDGTGAYSVPAGSAPTYKGYDHSFINGETFTIANDANSLAVYSATNGITFTIKMPVTPTNGQRIIIYQPPDNNTYFITFSPNTSQSIASNPNSFSHTLSAGMICIWNATKTTWYCMRGFQ